ncbi:LPXTG-motif cell wall anchor domain-containing protein [Acetoanaerobium noterae]|uniref:LPXTG-motif cell wall anchor domain-containing protein n=1 Tax=Acetoanaerobium noterae TaxID=745369 RepID=A0A1T5BS05_9FIRM|nr:LPXTG cell wall anchor domain-containing protein [Acetoanaerobium noterae]SKB50016.1 LPXTG-motif cell wall anchor domain-containing protein [Acetoanaerobium noterae]
MYKRIAIGISSIALSLALIVSGLILQSPSIAFANNIEVSSDATGQLKIEPVGDKFFDLSNMGPGDGTDSDITPNDERSTIKITNGYSQRFQVWLIAKRDMGIEIQSPDLYDQLMLEVVYRGETDQTSIKGYAKDEMSLGFFEPGESQIMNLKVSLPEELGNEYQGKEAGVIWSFRAEIPDTPPPPPPPPPDDDDDDEDEPEDVPEEPVPLAVVEPVPEEIIPEEIVPLAVPEVEEAIEEEPVPLAVPKLPRTGGMAPIFFYSAGAVLLGAGVVILRRKDDDDEK